MSRRAHHIHFDSGRTQTAPHREQKIGFCGDDSFLIDISSDTKRVTCPKCSALLAKLDLKTYHDAGNPALDLVACPSSENRRYRFAYQALLGGEHVGYVVYDGAYGNGAWYIARIRVGDDDKIDTGELTLKSTGSASRYDRPQPYMAKEQALLAVPHLHLESIAQIKAKREEWARRSERNRALHEAEEAEAEKNRSEALAALIEIRNTSGLSNFQRNGIEFAIKRLAAKEAEGE